MKKFKVAITAPYMQPVIERFRSKFEEKNCELVIPEVEERCEVDQLLGFIGNIDGLICGDDRVTPEVVDAAKNLKVISKWGTGVDSIDREYCAKKGVAVCRTPNAFSEPVADSVLGYILCFARSLPWMDRDIKNGIWHKRPGNALSECTLGIIGTGDVGKAVARRAKPFGMRILGNDLQEMPKEFISETGIRMVEKEELLRESDFISINTDLNESSHHLLSTAEFNAMPNHAVVINAARGPCIDEKALISALQNKQIAGAGLDVFEVEPIPESSPLLKMDNVMMAPHNSNSSPMYWERVHENTMNNLFNHLV